MRSSIISLIGALGAISMAAREDQTFAVLRFNDYLTDGCADPIVSPGERSSHSHQVLGGSGFSLDVSNTDLKNAKCTNAKVKGDNSNYWYPKLYFQDPKDGTFTAVELLYANAYYFFHKTKDDVKAFPLGLGVVSGDAMLREAPLDEEGFANLNTDPSKGKVNPATIVCPRNSSAEQNIPTWPKGSDGTKAGVVSKRDEGKGVGFPTANCDGYGSPMRIDTHFPSCYNPKKGLRDFKNNMAFPEDQDGYLNCPSGWTHVPELFLEVYWNTPKFDHLWERDGKTQPFVFANGDTTGYSSHADLLAGWDEKILQHIIDTCNEGTEGMDKCAGITINEEKCTIPDPTGDNNSNGSMKKLPRNNPLSGFSYGPAAKPPASGSNTGSGNGSSSGGDSEEDDSDQKTSEKGSGSKAEDGSDEGSYKPTKPPVKEPTSPAHEEPAHPKGSSTVPTITQEVHPSKPTKDTSGGPPGAVFKPEEPGKPSPEEPSKKPKVCKAKKGRKGLKHEKVKKPSMAADEGSSAYNRRSQAARASGEAATARKVRKHIRAMRRHNHGHS